MFKQFLFLTILFFSTLASGLSLNDLNGVKNNNAPLPAEEAFPFEVEKTKDGFKFIFDIANGHYLYKDKFKLTINNNKMDLPFPKGKIITDEYFGTVEVFYYGFESIVKYNKNEKNYKMDLEYQGCSSNLNLCYPVSKFEHSFVNENYNPDIEIISSDKKNLEKVEKSNDEVSLVSLASTNNTQRVVDYITQNKTSPLLFLTFVFMGFIIAFTPCIYPMMPIIVATTSISKTPKKSAAFYVLGMILAYASIGLLAGMFKINPQIAFQSNFISYFVGFALFIGSLYLFGIMNKVMPESMSTKLTEKINKIETEKDINQIIIGYLSSLLLSPCSVAPLLGVLIFINQVGEPLFGALLLAFMGFGIGIPLFLLSTSLRTIMPNNGSWMNIVKEIMAYGLLFGSIYMIYDPFNPLIKTFSWTIISIVLFVKGSLLFGLTIRKTIGLLIIIFSIFLFLFNNLNLEKLNYQKNNILEEKLEILEIKSLNDYKKAINETNKPIFVDFYADWCITCVRLENNVLNKENIIKYLNNNFLVLKIDLTDISNEEQELMDSQNIIAIPYYVFMDKNKKASVYTGDLSYVDFFDILKMNNEAAE